MDLVTKAKRDLESRGWKIEEEPGRGFVLINPLGNLIMDRGNLHWTDLREAIDAADRIEDKRGKLVWE